MKAKSRVVTFRMDQATWDFMRQLVPYTRYKKASSFIREGIELLLKRRGGAADGVDRRSAAEGVTDPAPVRADAGRPSPIADGRGASPSDLWRCPFDGKGPRVR